MARMARNNSFVSLYLVAYNLAQASGWTIAIARILQQVFLSNSVAGTFAAAGGLIKFLQLAAFMEVVHAAIGLVPSPVFPSFLQWAGRYHWIAAVVFNVKQVQTYPSVFITFVSWAVTEVIRYPQYAFNTLGCSPWWLTWLRYSIFIPLYPVGALCGEVLLLYQALPFIRKLNLYNDILPFDYYDFIRGVLIVYPFLWLTLYIHMFKQRNVKLAKTSTAKKKSRAKRSD